jgi:quercetin dioxygenase-like cupin family protein
VPWYGAGVDRWHLPSVEATGKREPRVLFSTSACRAVVIDLSAGEVMGDHQVRERAVLEVVSGRVSLDVDGQEAECEPGTLATFAPGERHAVRALEDSRVLLLLAPWPAEGHFQSGEDADPERVAGQGAVPPLC